MQRYSTIEDLAAISRLRLKMFQEIGTTDRLVSDFLSKSENFYSSKYLERRCIHALYEVDGIIVGCAGGIFRSDEFVTHMLRQADYGYIMDVYVEPEFRRQGIAGSLVEMIVSWLSKGDIEQIHLDASTLSGDLYLKMGFCPTRLLSKRLSFRN